MKEYFCHAPTFTSSGTGFLTFALTSDTSNVPVINGFSIDAIPEPSAALLGGIGLLALLRRRR